MASSDLTRPSANEFPRAQTPRPPLADAYPCVDGPGPQQFPAHADQSGAAADKRHGLSTMCHDHGAALDVPLLPASPSPLARLSAQALTPDFDRSPQGAREIRLKKLLDTVIDRRIGRLVITHEDRLLRFGAELVFTTCEANRWRW